MRTSSRVAPVFLAGALSACGGGAGLTPTSPHGAAEAAKTTKATFTIRWTNPSAPASVRRKDTISPSAQSVAISINGTESTVANRNGSPSQSITLIAPVGNDLFLFNIYDGPNGGGHLLGTATVSQLIVDGAANNVTAVIQAVCAVTNVQYANDDVGFINAVYGATGIYAATLQSVVLAGKSSATLVVGPEDADGNVIIAGTGGTVSYQITGSGAASVTPIDGAHIQLTPLSGFRSTTPDTLTLAAPTCPTTTVAVEHSPAIFVENTSYNVYVFDWYGDELSITSVAAGDALIGYDTHSQSMMTYNAGTGQVNAYTPNLQSHTAKYTLLSGYTACWSNYTGGVVAAAAFNLGGGNYDIYTYNFANPTAPIFMGDPGATSTHISVACSTYSTLPNAYLATNEAVYQFSLASNFIVADNGDGTIVSMATDDRNNELYAFNSGSPYVSVFNDSLPPGPLSANWGFTSAPVVGGSDTDSDDAYAVLTGGAFGASSPSGGGGTLLPNFGYQVGTGLAIAVISTNER